MRLLVSIVVLLAAAPSHAADIKAASTIAGVTVFPNGAEITRTAEVSAPAGSSVFVIQDLPANIDTESVRVEGEMTGGVEISSVDASQIFIKKPGVAEIADATERQRLEDEIQALRDERASLDGVIEGANAQKALAQNLAKLPLASSRGQQPSPAPDWNGLFDLIGGRLGEIQKTILASQVKQRAIDLKIKELEERLNREPPEETERTEVRVFIEASSQAAGKMRIRYRSANAGWSPAYDARLATGDKDGQASLALTRRATVTQETGEDWENVTMMLSTARPGGSTAAPDIRPTLVDFRKDYTPTPKAMLRQAPLAAPEADQSRFGASKSFDKETASGAEAMPAPITQAAAVIENSTYQAVFKIPAKVSIKTGSGDKKVLISTEAIKPTVKIISVPKQSTTAFLNANFTYKGEAALLPGEAALYRDNVYVGTGQLPLIASGQEFNLGFGADDAVKVNRISVKREKGETGLLTSSNVDEQHFSITVKNLHAKPVSVMILDQMPYSEDEKIVVEMLPVTTQPVETNHDDKRGVLAWEMDIKPGEEKVIFLSYQITWPLKREVVTVDR
ncbi:MAG: mucoidy inhibitor MuiA family protein [Chitinophagales bacterium]|nr:mucoidy inhibitor MuiA family protein [Hyphomicrobiales bacterium]